IRRPASTTTKKTTVVRIALPATRRARIDLFQRNAGADDEQPRPRTARTRPVRRSRLDFVDADVEAERQMLLGKPTGAAAVVPRGQRFGIGVGLGGSGRMQRPP